MKKQSLGFLFWVFIAPWSMVIGYSAAVSAAADPLNPADACTTLIGKRIPASEIDLPTSSAVVQSAVLVPATQAEINDARNYTCTK